MFSPDPQKKSCTLVAGRSWAKDSSSSCSVWDTLVKLFWATIAELTALRSPCTSVSTRRNQHSPRRNCHIGFTINIHNHSCETIIIGCGICGRREVSNPTRTRTRLTLKSGSSQYSETYCGAVARALVLARARSAVDGCLPS